MRVNPAYYPFNETCPDDAVDVRFERAEWREAFKIEGGVLIPLARTVKPVGGNFNGATENTTVK